MVASIPVRHRHDTVLGPAYDTTGLRKWLGLTRQAVAWRVRGGSRLACATGDGQLVYSAWQIRNDGTTVPQLAAVRKIQRPRRRLPACQDRPGSGQPASVSSERSNRTFNR